MTEPSPEPAIIGYVAPIHAQGAMGWMLLGVLAALIAGGGALSANLPLLFGGLAGVVVAGAGYLAYERVVSKWALVRVFPDRIEFVRGPQKGVLPFAEVTALRQLHWAHSWFPYQRAATVLVLQSTKGEYQVGRDMVDYTAVQEAVVRLLNEYHAARAVSR
ncbi:MAG: hypothetical protein AB7J35_15825 [Dehalococcoidia bacterium]